MIYLLSAVLILFVAFLLTRVRIRFEIAPERRILFIGLGRSGPEIDFLRREGVVKLFGLRLKKFSLDRETQPSAPKPPSLKPKIEPPAPRRKQQRSIRETLDLLPSVLSASWKYLLGVMRATIVEQAEGEIEAGFATPDVTGQVFGYYQAALAIAPGLFGRVAFVPDWSGPSFAGSARVTFAWPVYRLLGLTLLYMWRLPIRKIYRLARG